MEFELPPTDRDLQQRSRTLAPDVQGLAPANVIQRVQGCGWTPSASLQSTAAVVQALAERSPSAGLVCALHDVAVHAVRGAPELWQTLSGGGVGAVALSITTLPTFANQRLQGPVSWVAPLTSAGVLVLGAKMAEGVAACAAVIPSAGLLVQIEDTAGFLDLSWGQITCDQVEAVRVGRPEPVMARARTLLAAVGLGVARRALDEALTAARLEGATSSTEQTVQGLLADAATEIEAAQVLLWQASLLEERVTLAAASMAKLAATTAADGAVSRAAQVAGVGAFRRGHVLNRLAQDVRALELFAGRTETLRAAVAEDW